MFLKNFYITQTLSSKKLAASSFVDPFPDATVFSVLPLLIDYYLTRWNHLNLLSSDVKERHSYSSEGRRFLESPQGLLKELEKKSHLSLDELEEFL